MSVVIAQRLHALSRQANQMADHATTPDNKRALAEMARELLKIAEQLERDTRD